MKHVWTDGATGRDTKQIETLEVAGEVRTRVWIADDAGVFGKDPDEDRAATRDETKVHERHLESEAITAMREAQRAEIAELAVSDPDEVTRRILRKEITVEKARELGWKPTGARLA
jgi:hypothetical protein